MASYSKNTRRAANSGLVVDTTDLRSLGKALRQSKGELNKHFRASLREIGRHVAADAKVIASAHSQSIPPTIRARSTGVSITIEAGGDSPLARLWEVGNIGKADDSMEFRHPVFGTDDPWVEQKRYPFLKPAAEKNQASTAHEVERAINDAFRAAGLQSESE